MDQKENIYQFIDLPRIDPPKKSLDSRKESFVEIYEHFSLSQAKAQADRCLSCGNPYCQFACPLHNNIPNWLRLVYENRIMDAAELAYSTNTLPEICGRVCPQDRLCEGACTLNAEFGAVTIGSIEKFIIEEAIKIGWTPKLNEAKKVHKKVAVIGAGPASLGCADTLIKYGLDVDVFEKQLEIGGLLTFGIPSFKLEKDVIIRRREMFEKVGIKFHLGTEIGVNGPSFEKLLKEYDAIFIGVGVYKSMKADIPNEDANGVYSALPFLIGNTKKIMGIDDGNYVNVKDKTVVVIGGGDTAMDCVRTSIRHHAKKVTCVYRRDENNMPGSKKEVNNAREEGANFYFNAQPIKVEINDKNEVTGLEVIRTRLGPKDKSNRQMVENIPNSEEIISCDILIVAFGFTPHYIPWLKDNGINIDKKGRIIINNDYPQQTTNPKVFAGGDITRGSDLVVTAINEGRKAANNILDFLDIE